MGRTTEFLNARCPEELESIRPLNRKELNSGMQNFANFTSHDVVVYENGVKTVVGKSGVAIGRLHTPLLDFDIVIPSPKDFEEMARHKCKWKLKQLLRFKIFGDRDRRNRRFQFISLDDKWTVDYSQTVHIEWPYIFKAVRVFKQTSSGLELVDTGNCEFTMKKHETAVEGLDNPKVPKYVREFCRTLLVDVVLEEAG